MKSKQQLYESIMKSVSKQVKKSLNEANLQLSPEDEATEALNDLIDEGAYGQFINDFCDAFDEGTTAIDIRDLGTLLGNALKERVDADVKATWERYYE